jgi:hypothetical protein
MTRTRNQIVEAIPTTINIIMGQRFLSGELVSLFNMIYKLVPKCTKVYLFEDEMFR